MPCPPSMEELRFPYLDSDYSKYTIDLKKYLEEYPAAKEFFEKILKLALTEIPEGPRKDGVKVINTPMPYIDFGKGVYTFDEIEKYEKIVSDLRDAAHVYEVNLCILRDAIFKSFPFIPAKKVTDKLRSRFEVEKALHLKHREEDRQQVLMNLKWMIERATTEGEKADLNGRLQKISSYTEDDILRDRNLF